MCETNKFPAIIELNVGGQHFTTALLTLTKCPGNMLSNMFSGNYSTIRDKDGRFFIDADGSHFIYILNFLRYGRLPPSSCVDDVYHEAVYFGIHELVTELEKYPCVLGNIQRNHFRDSFSGYQECLDSIVNTVSETRTSSTTSDVKVLLYTSENRPWNDSFNMNHSCMGSYLRSDKIFTANAKLGPWTMPCTEKEVFSCILYDLQSLGFTLTSEYAGLCRYVCDNLQCGKIFYNICFHWWKK